MDANTYWSEVYKIICTGDIEKAMAMCEREPYSAVVRCQSFLGWKYYNKREFDKALIWFSKAASQKDGQALFGIASVHVAKKEFQLSIPYFEEAAANGYERGYQWIGGIYQHGCGVSADIDKAMYYYQLGATHGYIMAERILIYFQLRRASVFGKIVLLVKLIKLLLRTWKISRRDKNDSCLADIPEPRKDSLIFKLLR